MNIERLRRVQAELRAKPHHYNQQYWFTPFQRAENVFQEDIHDEADAIDPMTSDRLFLANERDEKDRPTLEDPLCGTSACIAGTAVALFETASVLEAVEEDMHFAGQASATSIDFRGRATDILDLTLSQATLLFSCVEAWPEPFAEAYVTAKSLQERAEAAATFIDELIANPDVPKWPGLEYLDRIGSQYPYAVSGTVSTEDIPF